MKNSTPSREDRLRALVDVGRAISASLAHEEILAQIHGVGEGWQIVIDQPPDALDTLLIKVEAYPDSWENKEEKEKIRAEITSHIQARLGIGAFIEVKEPSSLPRFEGKAKRVLDRRKEEKLIA